MDHKLSKGFFRAYILTHDPPYPDFSREFILHTDADAVALEAEWFVLRHLLLQSTTEQIRTKLLYHRAGSIGSSAGYQRVLPLSIRFLLYSDYGPQVGVMVHNFILHDHYIPVGNLVLPFSCARECTQGLLFYVCLFVLCK